MKKYIYIDIYFSLGWGGKGGAAKGYNKIEDKYSLDLNF